MASSIDATKPTAGAALTADVRNNFSAAKTEIEALQAAVASALVAKAGDTMTGALNWATTQTIASAATTDIGAATSNSIIVSGTTTITALGTIAAGAERVVQFSGALTLTHNATSLILPGGASITTAAGDVAYFLSLGAGNWRCTGYQKASGNAVVSSGGTPTGSGTELQYRNGAAFGAVTGSSVSGANVTLTGALALDYGGGTGFNNHLTFNTSGNGKTTIGGYNSYLFVRAGINGATRFAVYSDGRTNRVGPVIPSGNDYRWSSTSDATGSPDLGLERISAGLMGVNDGSTAAWRDIKVRKHFVDATNTAGGTTGNQTINKAAGTVNFAAGATSLTVTSSQVTTASLIFCEVRTNDTTAIIKNVVPGSGSFVITLNAAATAETSVGFFVVN